jgi:hypothetical protein
VLNQFRQWADDGYGAFVWPETVIYLTPKLGKAEAAATMKPLLDFGKRLQKDNVPGATVFQGEVRVQLVHILSSWPTTSLVVPELAEVLQHVCRRQRCGTYRGSSSTSVPHARTENGHPVVTGFAPGPSRQFRERGFARRALVPSFRLLLGPPSSHEGDNTSSVHDAWRTAIFHVTLVATFNYDASPADMAAVYKLTDRAIDYVRRLTPNAAYSVCRLAIEASPVANRLLQNEASIHEPNHEGMFLKWVLVGSFLTARVETFWGRHYPELLRIKQK